MNGTIFSWPSPLIPKAGICYGIFFTQKYLKKSKLLGPSARAGAKGCTNCILLRFSENVFCRSVYCCETARLRLKQVTLEQYPMVSVIFKISYFTFLLTCCRCYTTLHLFFSAGYSGASQRPMKTSAAKPLPRS